MLMSKEARLVNKVLYKTDDSVDDDNDKDGVASHVYDLVWIFYAVLVVFVSPQTLMQFIILHVYIYKEKKNLYGKLVLVRSIFDLK